MVLQELDTTWRLNHDQVLKVFSINWRTIASQCCVNFCRTTTWTSHKHTPSSQTPLPSPPQGAGLVSLCRRAASCYLSISHVIVHTSECYFLNSRQSSFFRSVPSLFSTSVVVRWFSLLYCRQILYQPSYEGSPLQHLRPSVSLWHSISEPEVHTAKPPSKAWTPWYHTFLWVHMKR